MRLFQSISLFSLLVISFASTAQRENQRIISSYFEFEEESTEYLYGDNVVLRVGPTSESKALDTLSIGSEIKIVRKTQETASLNGLQWNWYQVKSGRKTGFILGGLIAMDRVRFDDVVYLVTMAGIDKSEDEYEYMDYKVRTRVIRADNEFYGHETDLNTNSFYIEVFGNRGLDGIDNMLRINLYAEACGVDGGEIYLFNDGEKLFKGISLSSVSDAGAFWFNESVVFPEDENGYEGMLLYERELGHTMDEEMNWSRATTNYLNLKWENGEFTPNIEEFEFGEDE